MISTGDTTYEREAAMQFMVDGDAFDTRDMINIDVDSIFFNIYVYPQRSMVFFQTFDEERGVSVQRARSAEAMALLHRLARSSVVDVPGCRELIAKIRANSGRGAYSARRPGLAGAVQEN